MITLKYALFSLFFSIILDNPLTCGCDIAWIIRDTDYLNRIIYESYPTCADGTLVSELSEDDYSICP